jgi:hypothetical protein
MALLGYPVWLRPAATTSVQRRAAKKRLPGAAQEQAPRHPGVKDTVIKGRLTMKAALALSSLLYIGRKVRCGPAAGINIL